MAPAYKLVYFNSRGASEIIRMLFKYGKIEFEDVRIEKEDWPEIKPTTPFGQLPYLEHNGRKVAQSQAIARYVAKLVGLAGVNDWESLEVDAVADTIIDMRSKLKSAFYEKDEAKKTALFKKAAIEDIPPYLPKLEAILTQNNGYFVNGKLTWVDILFTNFEEYFYMFETYTDDKNYIKQYQHIMALFKKVKAVPQIKAWIEERPVTQN